MRGLKISAELRQNYERSVQIYFCDIKKLKLISADDEKILVDKIRKGDELAVEHLICANLRFVISVARQYQNQGVAICDLINEGNLGLIAAARKFDDTRGFKFISFAVWWIRQYIIFAIAYQSRSVHVPYGHLTILKKYSRALSKLEQCFERQPTVEEIAVYLQILPKKINDLATHNYTQISVDQPINQNPDMTLLDILPSNDNHSDQLLLDNSLKDILLRSLIILEKRDRDIIMLFFGLDVSMPLSLREIAESLTISIDYVRRRKDYALLRIRDSSFGPLLQQYLS